MGKTIIRDLYRNFGRYKSKGQLIQTESLTAIFNNEK